MTEKPRRVKEIEKEAALSEPCQKIGSITLEGEGWETWFCPMEDGSATLIQEYESYALGSRRRTYQVDLTTDEVEKLGKKLQKMTE